MHCNYNINGVVYGACCYCSEYWDYADARFVLFDGRHLWFISVCRCDNYVCCDCHDACCYCAEHWDYADARFCLSAWWVDRLLPICGSLDRLHCNYNINGVVHSNDVSA